MATLIHWSISNYMPFLIVRYRKNMLLVLMVTCRWLNLPYHSHDDAWMAYSEWCGWTMWAANKFQIIKWFRTKFSFINNENMANYHTYSFTTISCNIVKTKNTITRNIIHMFGLRYPTTLLCLHSIFPSGYQILVVVAFIL